MMSGGWYAPKGHVGGTILGLALAAVTAVAGLSKVLGSTEKETLCGIYIEPHTNYPDPELTYTFDINGKKIGFRGNPAYAKNMIEGESYCATFVDPIFDSRTLTEEPRPNPLQPRQNSGIRLIE